MDLGDYWEEEEENDRHTRFILGKQCYYLNNNEQ